MLGIDSNTSNRTKKVILDRDLPTAIIPEIDTEIAKDSIYRYFENQLGLTNRFCWKITIDALTDEDRELLDLNQHDINIVSVKSRVFTNDARQFQYTESVVN